MTKFLNNADVTGYISQTSVTSSLLKTDSAGKLVAAVAGTDYNAPNVSAVAGTLIREIRNTTGATLTKGTIVYISGATGNKPTVSKAIATGDSTSAQTFGICQTDIADNSNGYVVCVGDITGLDTSALTEGAQLYLSSTTAGAYTTTKQLAPAHLVYIGVVTRAHPTLGQIEVKIQNGYELDEIHDVAISSVTNNQGLFWESATSLWKNKTIAAVLGYTPVDASLTANYIPKATGATTLANSNIQDSGSLITLGSDTTISSGSLGIGTTSLTQFNLRVSKNITGATTAYGIYLDSTLQSDVTNIGYMFMSAPSIASSFAANNVHHFRANPVTLNSGSSISTQVGYMVSSAFTNATANFAFRSDMPATSGSFNLYMVGTANNYLAGSLGIGQTVLTGYTLRVGKNLTGATATYGIVSEGIIQSDVTSRANYFITEAKTIAATFTLSNLYHYRATQSTIGAGSTVTNQYAFFVAASLTGATNNYAFYSDLAAGTNAWNLYMNGTAQNYLAGALSIGVTTANASALLQVDSTTKGFLPPRMTAAQRAAIATPAEGLVVFQTDGTIGLYVYANATWRTLAMV